MMFGGSGMTDMFGGMFDAEDDDDVPVEEEEVE